MTDLEIILKDCEIKDNKVCIRRDCFDLNSAIDEHSLREKLYHIYLNSDINICGNNDITNNYLDIINKSNKDFLNNFWLYLNNEGDDIRAKKGFTEKVIPNSIFFSDKNAKLVEKGEVQNINSPAFFQENGWFWILGNDYPPNSYDELFRYYFNFKCNSFEGLTLFLKFIFSEFNARNISFKLKLPLNSKDFNRSDNVVLYVDKLHFWMVEPLILKLQEHISIYLNPNTPLFTKKITNGVGWAEEPHDSYSFSFGESKVNVIIGIFKKLLNKKKDIPSSCLLTEFTKDSNCDELTTNTHLNRESIFKDHELNNPNPLSKINYSIFVDENLYIRSLRTIVYQICASTITSATERKSITWLKGSFDFNEEIHSKRNNISVTKVDDSFCNGIFGIAWLIERSLKILNDFPLHILTEKVGAKVDTLNTFEALFFLYDSAYFNASVLNPKKSNDIGQLKNTINAKIETFFEGKDFSNDLSINDLSKLTYLKDFCWLAELITNKSFQGDFLIPFDKIKIEKILNTFNQSKIYNYTIDEILKDSKNVIKTIIEQIKNKTNPQKYIVDSERLIGILSIYFSKIFSLNKRFGIGNKVDIINILEKLDEICIENRFNNNILKLVIVDCHNIDSALEMDFVIKCKDECLRKIFITDRKGESLAGRASNYHFLFKLINELEFTHQFGDDNSLRTATERYLDILCNDFLSKGLFPDLGFQNNFHNPGIGDGIAGIGYLLVKKIYDSNSKLTRLPALCFFDL